MSLPLKIVKIREAWLEITGGGMHCESLPCSCSLAPCVRRFIHSHFWTHKLFSVTRLLSFNIGPSCFNKMACYYWHWWSIWASLTWRISWCNFFSKPLLCLSWSCFLFSSLVKNLLFRGNKEEVWECVYWRHYEHSWFWPSFSILALLRVWRPLQSWMYCCTSLLLWWLT